MHFIQEVRNARWTKRVTGYFHQLLAYFINIILDAFCGWHACESFLFVSDCYINVTSSFLRGYKINPLAIDAINKEESIEKYIKKVSIAGKRRMCDKNRESCLSLIKLPSGFISVLALISHTRARFQFCFLELESSFHVRGMKGIHWLIPAY